MLPENKIKNTHSFYYDRAFWGHPKGLMPLFTTEMWERFSYYGMRAILVYFLYATLKEGGLGLSESLAKSLAQIYSASVFLLSIVGGWLADRLWGLRKATLYGAIVITLGHVALALPAAQAAYLGIALVAIGTGLLKPNISTMVGKLYADNDTRRDAGFSLFYMGINVGALLAPFVVSAVKNYFNDSYHAGFAVPALGMVIALFLFIKGRKYLPDTVDDVPNPLTESESKKFTLILGVSILLLGVLYLVCFFLSGRDWLVAVINALTIFALAAPGYYFVRMWHHPQVSNGEKRRLQAFIPIFIASMLFWMIYEQASSSMAVFVQEATDLSTAWGNIDAELFQAISPLCVVTFAPIFTVIWQKLGDRQPSTATKMAIGLGFASFSFLWLGAWAIYYTGIKAPMWVITLTWVYQTIGELCLSPVGLAATTVLAPRIFRSQAMALWFLSSAAGQAIAAQVLRLTGEGEPGSMFIYTGAVAGVFALLLVMVSPWINRRIRTEI